MLSIPAMKFFVSALITLTMVVGVAWILEKCIKK
jgi:hypothetical protein